MLKLLIFIVFMLPRPANSQEAVSVFPGTWHSQNGNTLFVVSLWQEANNKIAGHYKMVECNNGIIGNVLYRSNKIYEGGFKFPSMIYVGKSTFSEMSGFVDDNTITSQYVNFITGILEIKLTQPTITGCTNCTIQATWKVTRPTGGFRFGEPIPFNIPTDIVLTKVSSTINLD